MAAVADFVAEFEHRLLIQPAAITRHVQEFADPKGFDQHRLWVERKVAEVDEQVKLGKQAREIAWQSLSFNLGDKDLADLDEWIKKIDESIDRNTKEYIDASQYLRRETIKMKGKISKFALADFERVMGRHHDAWARQIAETIDFATFLRAVRASNARPAPDAPTFDNASDLTRYLEAVVGEA